MAKGAALSLAWKILLILTFARLTMGLQFQAVPALASYYTAQGLSFAALGTLTGAYLLPGVIVALAGGALSRRFGDIRVLLTGLALMCAGGLLDWWTSEYGVDLAARLVAGAGAVCVNVFGTKMAADWFAGRSDLPTAMGVLVSSWPAGIAVAALGLPLLAAATGFGAAQLVAPILCLCAFALLLAVWQEPAAKPTVAAAPEEARFTVREWSRVSLSGLIWGLYNVAFVGVIAWTPGYLEEGGLSAHKAGVYGSLIGWIAIFSVALGGWAASRVARPDYVALGCFFLSAVLLLGLTGTVEDLSRPWFMALLGFAMGPAAAMIMTLPVTASRASLRATAMGMYFAFYYALMAFGPPVLGRLRDVSGDAAAPLLAAAALMLICIGLWLVFRLSAGKASLKSTGP